MHIMIKKIQVIFALNEKLKRKNRQINQNNNIQNLHYEKIYHLSNNANNYSARE